MELGGSDKKYAFLNICKKGGRFVEWDIIYPLPSI
jgi:hypothetical protein